MMVIFQRYEYNCQTLSRRIVAITALAEIVVILKWLVMGRRRGQSGWRKKQAYGRVARGAKVKIYILAVFLMLSLWLDEDESYLTRLAKCQ
jgi:hypothetical protein